eukprot:232129_1
MATTHMHVPTQSQQVLIPNDSTVNSPQPATTIDSNLPNPQRKKKLIIISIIACIIIIVVVIIACVISFRHVNTNGPNRRWPEGDCGCDLYNDTYLPHRELVCGNKTKPLTENECPYECTSVYDKYDIYGIYYVRNTSECYCYTHRYDMDEISSINSTNNCFNGTNFDVRKWSIACCVYGRPYFINSMTLQSNVTYIDCKNYIYYDNEQWKEFISNNAQIDYEMSYKWKQQALSEYASIATFSKFSLELMSIGAPLWFIELSNQASIDEIRHAKVSFDIANMYLNSEQCMISDVFPSHVVNIDADWNRISKDVVIGGCLGETLSAFKMIKNKYGNIIDEYLYSMAMDEIKHSALAWVTIKWMIDNVEENNIDVGNVNWWKQIMYINKKSVEEDELYVYNVVIASMLDKLWMDYGYEEFYRLGIEHLSYHFKFIFNQSLIDSCVV